MKLLRAFLDVPQGITFMTVGVVKAVVAIAEMGAQGEDKLSGIAVETLAELRIPTISRLTRVVMDTSLVMKSSGLRPLLQTLLDGPPELSMTLIHPLLYISDFPSTRRVLYPEPPVYGPSALGIVLSELTNVVDPPPKTERDDPHGLASITEEARLRGNAQVVAGMMSSWSGLLALCARSSSSLSELPRQMEPPTFLGVRSLVDALRIKSLVVRDVLLDLWFEVLHIRIGSWGQNFLAGRRLTGTPFLTVNTVFGRPLAYHTTEAADPSSEPDGRTNLFAHYKALILTVLISSGLLDALAFIVESSANDTQARKATLLLGEILQSAANVLPISYCTQIQSVPRLVSAASRFQQQSHFAAISSIFQIDSLAQTKHRATLTPPAPMAKLDTDSGGAVEQVKLKLGMQIDDAHFRQMLLDTQVLITNNYTKWQWEKLYELFQGPLMNQKRLDESIKGIRLLPKLFGFYRPSKEKFSKIKKMKVCP
jgi:rapamycin-insensitive companion of mTOR